MKKKKKKKDIQKRLQNIDIDIYDPNKKKYFVEFLFSKDAKIIKMVIKNTS